MICSALVRRTISILSSRLQRYACILKFHIASRADCCCQVLAQPNLPYNIAPVVKFWVAQGYSQQGELADFSAVSAQNGAIDFTTGAGVGQDTALVSQGPDGQFTITYASSGAHGKK